MPKATSTSERLVIDSAGDHRDGTLSFKEKDYAITVLATNKRYSVYVNRKLAGEVRQFGVGRNLSYVIRIEGRHGSADYRGSLVDNIERVATSYLYDQDSESEHAATVAQIKSVLPYQFGSEEAALDFAFTDNLNAKIVGTYYGAWFVGLYATDVAEGVATALREKVEQFRYRVYGNLDPRLVQSALTEQGVTNVHFDSTYTETVVYLSGGIDGTLLISKDGDIALVRGDGSGGLSVDQEIAHGDDAEAVVKAVVRWWKSYDLQRRAESLLEHLETEVPDGVAHYAVEQAKKALRTLAREAHTVDFTYTGTKVGA